MWIGYFVCEFHSITGKQYCQKWKSLSRFWLCNPIDCSLPGSSVHELLQARVLEWIASPLSRGSSQPRDRIQVSRITGGFFTVWATREAQYCQKLIIKEGVGSAGAGNPPMNTHSYFSLQCQPWVDRNGNRQPLNLRILTSGGVDETDVYCCLLNLSSSPMKWA